uniref:Tetratricopeptide repeat domain 17 n=1 Tax=Scleropages formosus TaxID=113540 RepID=A0A8C9UYF9_SCLFO
MAEHRRSRSGSRRSLCIRWNVTLLSIATSVLLAEPGGATTHWVVTEDGKIQQQVDSPLNLKQPHDLVIFMRQESRVNYLKELEKQLVAQKIHIEENEDRDTGLEQRHYKEDPDCVAARVPLGDLDLYDGTFISLESKGISPEDYVDSHSSLPAGLEKPDCSKIFELPYSIHAFQHLRGVQERVNLTSPLLAKDDPIFSSLSHKLGRSMDEAGHRINQGLLRNSSSWVLYNLASFYWRMKNEPRYAVDCAVRALHFSPRQHKDVALVNMANVLHRAHFSADAAILAHAALDLTADLFTSHYTLGNIYAMLGEYNHSVLCYEQALQARSGFEQALRRKHAVLCQQKLEQRLEAQHRSLQRTLNELKEYQKQHDHYLRQQEALEKHKLLQEEQILRNIIHETQMAKEAQLGNHQMCRLGQQGSLLCPFDLPVRYHRGDLFESVHSIQVSSGIPPSALLFSFLPFLSEGGPSSPVGHGALSNAGEYHMSLWPTRAECAHRFPAVPATGLLPTFYLAPETRGFGVLYEDAPLLLVTDPPDCGAPPQSAALPVGLLMSAGWELDGKDLPDPFAAQVSSWKPCVTLCVENYNTCWLVQNEAALYWRAKGNGSRALSCVLHALCNAPAQHRDLCLLNAANLLLHRGLAEEAEPLLEEALALNASEPLSLLSQVTALLSQGNLTGALAVFRQALFIPGSCPQCHASLPLLRCLQFYPLLYNLTWQPCPGEYLSAVGPQSSLFLFFLAVVFESNGSGGAGHEETDRRSAGKAGEGKMSGESSEEEEEQEWQLKEELMGAFEGALDSGGRRGDLRGIRVLTSDGVAAGRSGGSCFGNCEDDEGAEWITFQVKRVRKPKAESSDSVSGDEDAHQGEPSSSHSVLEISGPTIPSPGPSGRWRDYASLGWPGPEECQRTRRVELATVASTWLAVSAKNIDITEHIDFATPIQEPAAEPVCNANLPASMHTLDHLSGVANRAAIHYTGESQLREVLQNLGKDKFSPQSFEQVGTRIAKVLEKNQTSWVLSSMAALYWRVKGQGKRAIDCLRQALNHAPHHMKDVPLISLANIFQNARLWEDALTVARMAVEIAPHFVVNHFTLANVYIAMEEFEKAMQWYESTLKLQPEFSPAKDRLRTIQCYLLTKKERRVP